MASLTKSHESHLFRATAFPKPVGFRSNSATHRLHESHRGEGDVNKLLRVTGCN